MQFPWYNSCKQKLLLKGSHFAAYTRSKVDTRVLTNGTKISSLPFCQTFKYLCLKYFLSPAFSISCHLICNITQPTEKMTKHLFYEPSFSGEATLFQSFMCNVHYIDITWASSRLTGFTDDTTVSFNSLFRLSAKKHKNSVSLINILTQRLFSKTHHWFKTGLSKYTITNMMTSSNGKIFRVTGPLGG